MNILRVSDTIKININQVKKTLQFIQTRYRSPSLNLQVCS